MYTQEDWWNLKEDISIGDKITFKTTNAERKQPLEVIDQEKDDYIIESKRGTKYILGLSEIHPLEPYSLTIRKKNGYDSLGKVTNIKIH